MTGRDKLVMMSTRNRIQSAGDGQRSQPSAPLHAGRSFAVERQRFLPRRPADSAALLSVSSSRKISAVSHIAPCELHMSILRCCHDGLMGHRGS